MIRTLPKWNDSMSDGCSIVPFLPLHVRILFQRWLIKWIVSDIEAVEKACIEHDRAYYLGGSALDRRLVDQKWYATMKVVGVPWARVGLEALYAFGGPEYKIEGVSWSWGGRYFAYSDGPAIEIETDTK